MTFCGDSDGGEECLGAGIVRWCVVVLVYDALNDASDGDCNCEGE